MTDHAELVGIRPDDHHNQHHGDDDHTRVVVIGGATPTTIQPDDVAVAGSSTTGAAADHKHAIVAAVAGTSALNETATEGSATSFSRSDHRHEITTPGSDLTFARLRLTATDAADLASTLHAYQIGPTSSFNQIQDPDEVQVRNNGAAATYAINPAGGVVVARDDDSTKRAILAPYRQWAQSTSGYTVTGSIGDITGCSVTFTTEFANAQYRVTGNFRFLSSGLSGGGLHAGYIAVDGVELAAIVRTWASPLNDESASCTWVGKLASVGSHTIKLRALRTSTGGTVTMATDFGTTAILLEVWG